MENVTIRIGKLSFTPKDMHSGLRGHYGKVFHGCYEDTVDVSVIKIDTSEFKVDTKILRETDLHLNHVRFYGQETSNHHSTAYTYVPIEVCAGNLKNLVSGEYKGPPIGNRYEILFQITNGLDFLHSKQFFHRDLKPSTILISHPLRGVSPRMKLSNFAFSPISNPLRPLSFWKLAGTNKAWMAPEIYQLSEIILPDLPMNIFSLGLIFSFFLSGGLHPFALDKEERITKIKNKQPIILTADQLVEDNETDEVFNLISLMLSFEWDQRPTVSEILAFLNQQLVLVGTQLRTKTSFSNVVENPSRNFHNSSILALPRPTSAADQVEDESQNNANSTASQPQDSTLNASSRSRSSQSQSSSAGGSSAFSSDLQQDQERTRQRLERDQGVVRRQIGHATAYEATRNNQTNKRRTDQSEDTASKAIKLENQVFSEPSTGVETVALDANNSDNDIEIIREVINTPDSELGATVKTEPQSEEISTREPDGEHQQTFTFPVCSSPIGPSARPVRSCVAAQRSALSTCETPPVSMSSNSIHNSSTDSHNSDSTRRHRRSLRPILSNEGNQLGSCSASIASEFSRGASNEPSSYCTEGFSKQKSQEFYELCHLRKLKKAQLANFHLLAKDKEVDVNFTGIEKKVTPLLCLCLWHESDILFECVQTLLQRDELDVNFRDSGECWNALATVCRWYSKPTLPKIVLLLLDRGCQVDSVNEEGANALMVLCANYKHSNLIEVAGLLLDNGIDSNLVCKKRWWNALICLCHNYHSDDLIDILNLLLDYESQLDVAESKEGNALIVVCAIYRHRNLIDIVRLFIRNRIDVTSTNPTSGANALMTVCSVYSGDNLYEIIEILLEAGVDINALARNQTNALINLAIEQSGHRDFIRILSLFIVHKINVNACDEDGWSVLHVLCKLCEIPKTLVEAITLLKANGIDTQLRTKKGARPVDLLTRRTDLKQKNNNIEKLLK